MKKVIYLLMSLLMIAFTTYAQDKAHNGDQPRDQDELKLHECIIFDDGEVYLLVDRDQDRIRLKDQIRLHDGTVVESNGMFTDAEGVSQTLRQGECLDMDGNRYASHEGFRRNIQIREQAMNQPHYVFRKGQLYSEQNQQRMQVRERIRLGDATVDHDGNLELAQARTRLCEGECLDPDGNLYGSQAQFRKHAQLRLQAMSMEHFMFRDGAMYQVRNQIQSQIKTPVTLANGIEVRADGAIQTRDQTRLRLRDGECLDREGSVFDSQTQFREQTQVRLMAMNQEHFVYQDGVLFHILNQERQRVREQVRLRDGTTVDPDGTVRTRTREQSRLRNGECFGTDGNRFSSQQQFREQTQNQFTAMSEPHFFYQNGKAYQMKNQIRTQLHERWSLKNGLVINPDGSYQMKNGNPIVLEMANTLTGKENVTKTATVLVNGCSNAFRIESRCVTGKGLNAKV